MTYLEGQPMMEWTRYIVQRERTAIRNSTALLPATRIQVVMMEIKFLKLDQTQIALMSDTITQDTERPEPPTTQKNCCVWITNLDSHTENRTKFLRELFNSCEKVLVVQIFQQFESVVRATMTINATRDRLEAATIERNGKILLGRLIVLTFKRVPKHIVTGATKSKARVACERAVEEDFQ